MLLPRTLSTAGGDLRALAKEIAPRSASGRSSAPRWVKPALAIGFAAVFAWFLAAHGAGFARSVGHALDASPGLVILAAGLELASIAGYIALQHRVVSRADPRLTLRDSYDITLAGTVATRLLPTAGLGGAALTVWALRARGVSGREIAERLTAFLVLLYAVYLSALAAAGLAAGSSLGRIATAGSAVAMAAAVSLMLARGRPALRRAAGELVHPHPALLGALAWWGCDIAVLGALLHAFGAAPAIHTLVLAYFLGTLCNLLPLPGSLSGGLTGALVALHIAAAPALAAVLAYRALATWLPAASGLASVSRLRAAAERWRADAARTA